MRKISTTGATASILINNLFSYYVNDGTCDYNPFTNDDGLVYQPFNLVQKDGYSYPADLMFTDGLLWGGYHRGGVKVGGTAYSAGLQAGPIVSPGTAASKPTGGNPSDARYRIYRVRPDISSAVSADQASAILSREEVPLINRDNPITAQQLYNAYCRDWNEWPASDGAPFTDVDHNGIYDPAIDIPGVPGADQTLWYVANDLDSIRTRQLYGSTPIGIEMQKTVWAYRRTGVLDNTIFQRSRLINKSGSAIDSMFIAQFADPDIGGAIGYTDDAAGCDTLRNMAFVYNGTDNDGVFGAHAPAVGVDLLAGPAVPGAATDSAFFDFTFRKGRRNLPMSSMVLVIKIADEAAEGDYRGTTEFYSMMKGLKKNGASIINPQTGAVTHYVFSGNPVTQSGWVEGTPYGQGSGILFPGDRRVCVTSGPITMAPADTQEIVVAITIGIGADRLGSVGALQMNADALEKIFKNDFKLAAAVPPPAVTAVPMNGHILLTWDAPPLSSAVESFASLGYRFEGYNVYQMPNGDVSRAKRLATYDLVDNVRWVIDTLYDASANMLIPVKTAFGNDVGLRRFYYADWDSLTGTRLVNGTPYYCAVTAYAYDSLASSGTRVIESTPRVLEVVPQLPLPGATLQAEFGQVLSSDPARVRMKGMKTGQVIVRVIDPSKITGHVYSIVFSDTGAQASWSVLDSNLNRLVLSGQKNYTKVRTYDIDNPYLNDPSDPIVDGLQFSVSSAPSTLSYAWTLSTARLDPTYSVAQERDDVLRQINVYPNPYFAGNRLETSKYVHFVTFTHLPQKAVISILSLNGMRVRTLVKDDPSQWFQWDLTNDHGTQVASGMYLVHIAMPDLGVEKILKLAVIPAVTVPDHW